MSVCKRCEDEPCTCGEDWAWQLLLNPESQGPESQGFMPHNDPSRPPWLSRDWEDIDCHTLTCRYNVSGIKCGVPSLAKIGDDGKCTGFKLKETDNVSKTTFE